MELLERHFDIALKSPDGIKKLRELILSLAMQGKLVPQDASDQPASELLKEIDAEKKKLIKEGKIKKQEPLPPIKPEEIPYKAPTGWEWVRLGELLRKYGAGSTPLGGQKVYQTCGIMFLRSQNVWNDGLKIDDVARIDKSTHEKMSGTKVEVNDILLNITGASIGRSSIFLFGKEEANVSQHVAILRTIDTSLVPFLHLCVISPYFQKTIMDKQVGVSREGLSMAKLKEFYVPLPPLAEQKRIVAKIDQLMALCDKLEAERDARNKKRVTLHAAAMDRLLSATDEAAFAASWEFITRNFSDLYSVPENVAELKKAILQLAVMGKLVAQDPRDQPASELLKEIEAEKKGLIKEGKIKKQEPLPPIKPEEIPYEVPEGWEWVRLDALGLTQTGTTPPKKEPENFGDFIPFVGPGDMKNSEINYQNEGLSEVGINKGRLIPANSIMMVCIGGSIGKLAVNEFDVTCNQQINTITPYKRNEYKFLYWVMQSEMFQNQVVSQASGSATPIINKQKWSSICVPFAPLTEQKRIVAKVDQLMELCNSLEQQLQDSTRKQTAILEALLATM